MGPAMESLGTGTGRRKASLRPCSQRFHRWPPEPFLKIKKTGKMILPVFFVLSIS